MRDDVTRDFKTTIMARARRDQDFRAGMLEECVELVLNGEPEVGQEILGDLIEARRLGRVNQYAVVGGRRGIGGC